MFEYADLYFGREEALGGILSSGFSAGGDPLPPFVLDQLTFPYLTGRVFAEELYRRSGDNWETLDYALRTRPPASTEQILHPDKWIAIEQPVRVPAFSRVGEALGEGWRRTADDVLGEWATGRWLQSPSAGAGWGGDRYELWERGPSRAVLVMEWAWDTARDAEEFVARARTRAPDGAVVTRLGRRRASVVIASAPGDGAIARRVAAALGS